MLSACTAYCALEATGGLPAAMRMSPTSTISPTEPMKMYVGSAKARDASRTPRRFTMTISTTNPTASSTRQVLRTGSAEMMLSTPDATDTATVST